MHSGSPTQCVEVKGCNRRHVCRLCNSKHALSCDLLAVHAGEIAYGLTSILLITPLLGLLVAQLPLNPKPLAFGLGVVCTVPTALACGVAFVQVSCF